MTGGSVRDQEHQRYQREKLVLLSQELHGYHTVQRPLPSLPWHHVSMYLYPDPDATQGKGRGKRERRSPIKLSTYPND